MTQANKQIVFFGVYLRLFKHKVNIAVLLCNTIFFYCNSNQKKMLVIPIQHTDHMGISKHTISKKKKQQQGKQAKKMSFQIDKIQVLSKEYTAFIL